MYIPEYHDKFYKRSFKKFFWEGFNGVGRFLVGAISLFLFASGGYLIGRYDLNTVNAETSRPTYSAAAIEALSGLFGSNQSSYSGVVDLDEHTSLIEDQITVVGSVLSKEDQSILAISKEEVEKEVVEEVPIIEEKELIKESVACSQENLLEPTETVLINEVSWSGKKDHTSEEWIELLIEKSTNLDGWSLVSVDGGLDIKISDLTADGYVVLRRVLASDDLDKDYYVGNRRADYLYTGAISNQGEILRLFDADCALVHEIDASTGWKQLGGTASPDYRSLERGIGKWQTYAGNGANGVMGTPGVKNSEGISEEVISETPKEKKESSDKSPGVRVIEVPQEVSQCSLNDLNEPTKLVLFNEIAWSGNASSTSEEWIELKSDIASLSLDGWQLSDKDGEIEIIFSNEEEIDDYYLLKRILTTEDPSASYLVGEESVDLPYTGTLQNDNEELRLFDSSCNLVDQIVDVGVGWQNIGGSASPDYKSVERTDIGWQTYLGDGEGGIMGTPRKENSVLINDVSDVDNGEQEETDPPPNDEEEDVELEDQEEDSSGEESSSDEESSEEEEVIEEEEPIDEESPEEEEPIDEINLSIISVEFDLEGSDEGLERVVIENSGQAVVSIENYSLQYIKFGGTLDDLEKKNFESGNEIAPGGQFIIGMSCSSAVPCEGVNMSWSKSLNNNGGTLFIVSNQELITELEDEDIVTAYNY
ncbi:MAG: hypothetical protein COT88_01020 [Candidatus Colwellbacteria bacterium CG10_big_fil_rev_8_21_14_0_10_41_28]|uniref:LTD domain-containing protein n=1 Tax=Candidatus Colwellbacteria bacterium CG10_big_fil_rev_8_21_14_0_10_41_28 TaxID=1974539 RepID=A0A2H0VHF6_9BACT|nr:MAG: hypothetical protein COT88_01020 [Candidatus Colwellbacteria bacterium CG10_big_fil_rev_8_21_14_0_10_41_28]